MSERGGGDLMKIIWSPQDNEKAMAFSFSHNQEAAVSDPAFTFSILGARRCGGAHNLEVTVS